MARRTWRDITTEADPIGSLNANPDFAREAAKEKTKTGEYFWFIRKKCAEAPDFLRVLRG